MAIRFFEILRPVLDKNIDFIIQQAPTTRGNVYENIVAEAVRNRTEWFSDRVPNLNYQSPDCRLAYLYIVAAANAATFKHVIESDTDLCNYVLTTCKERSELKVCALGAGPGTELLAMAKFFDEQKLGYSVSIDFQLLDRVEEWANTWYGIRDEVNNAFRRLYGNNRSNWPVIPSGNFLACDVTQLERMGRLGHIWNQDLYVVNFLISEIFNDDPGLRAFLNQVAAFAPKGARFIFIERRGSRWETRMKSIADDAGLTLSRFKESKCDKISGEDPKSLGDIYTTIGLKQSPRMSWNIVYSIGTKD